MHEAKSNLSRLVELVESGAEKEIIIARNGKPAVRLAPIEQPRRQIQFGLAKGMWIETPEPSDELDKEIERMFLDSINDDP